MKQTAVEWLVEKLKSQGLLIGEPNNLIAVREAKEMEKQQQGYSEEEVDRILRKFRTDFLPLGQVNDLVFNEWFEQFKK